MTSGSKNGEIISRFLEHCEPLTAKEPLDFLDLDEDVFASPSDPVRTVLSLGDEYTADELVASGVAVVVPDGAVVPGPALANGGEPLIVLRDSETDEPYEMLMERGCLSAGTLPCFASLRDRHTRVCLDGGAEDVYAAFSIWDAVMLRAAGLPATLATGLHELPLDKVDQFCDSFSLRRDRGKRHRESDACDDQDETEDQPIDPIRALGLRLAGQAARAQSATDGSGDENLSGVGGAGSLPVKTRLAFVGWSPAALKSDIPGNLKSIAEHFAKLDRFIGIELFDLGLWLPENEEVERLLFFAELSHVFHTQTVLLAEKLNRQIAERGIDRVDALPEEQLKNLMAMADRLLNITKGIERWSPPPQTPIIQSEVLNSPTTLHLPHSG